MSKTGFSLIECMVYCLMITVIMMLWFNGVAFFTRLSTAQASQINTLSTLYSALDVFARDIRKAPRAVHLWLSHADAAFVFQLDDSSCIGWECLHGQLIRYQGNYTRAHKQWGKRTKSLVLDTVQKCFFSFDYLNDTINSIRITLVSHDKTVNRTIYILS